MAIDLDRDDEARMIDSIQQYFEEHMETSVGDLKASLLLKFVLGIHGQVASPE